MLAITGNMLLVQQLQHDFPDRDGLICLNALNTRFSAPLDASAIWSIQQELLALSIQEHIGPRRAHGAEARPAHVHAQREAP
jgi:hypothetical protein